MAVSYTNHHSTKGYLSVPGSHSLEISQDSSTFQTLNGSTDSLPKVASFGSVNIFKDGEIFARNSIRKCNGVLLQGPRKLFKLCLYGFILPALLITIPLYVRLILYPPFHYMMAPTDQRLLEHTSSSVWCRGQSVHMNGSFNAFLLPETPKRKRHYSTHQMLQHLTLKDDVKEYWGFFLQKGSVVSINLCNRYDGGMLMIMRGVHNLRKCAWVGEEDSAEQDEDHKDTSNESGQDPQMYLEYPLILGELLVEREDKFSISSRTGLRPNPKANMTSEERVEELDFYLDQVLKLSKNKKEIVERLKKQKSKSKLQNKPKSKKNFKRRDRKLKNKMTPENITLNASSKSEKLRRMKRFLEEDVGNEEEVDALEEQKVSIRNSLYLNVDNSSYEVTNETRNLYLSLFNLPKGLTYERGYINMTTPHDTSDEEHRSSFSSSEEALTKCEGLIGIMPLYPSRRCQGFDDSHTNKIRYRVPVSGTYYFVFSSDNEVFDSDVYLNMTLQRVVFNTEAAKETCVNKTDCVLSFSFWSHDQAVVEVPEGDWNAAYTMVTKCQPRVAVYLLFLFLIPVFILLCAFN